MHNSSEYYSELVSRNKVFIDYKLQRDIVKTRLAFAGCGLGSNVALMSARVGFTKFVLMDGDDVSISNLNRQTFEIKDVGKNKALCLKKQILNVNRNCEVKTRTKYINNKDVDLVINNSDIIINTIDFGDTFIKLTTEATVSNKIVILPFNVGYGVVIVVLDKTSDSISSVIKENHNIVTNGDLYRHLLSNINYCAPKYISQNIDKIFDVIRRFKYSPQLAIASSLNAAAINTVILKIIKGDQVKKLPGIIYFDLNDVVQC
ncbi:MAG: ThiF family adenylyltransferase [Patescibacteria group bacterium]|jgi:hypothetical protein